MLMKAVFLNSTGAPDVLQYRDLPRPTPAPGQVLVRTAAVSVNPIDTYIRSGNVKFSLPSPWIVGCDLAGTVEAVGDGCQWLRPGMRVWGSNQGLFGRQGTFAEYSAVDERWLYELPDGVSFEAAAAGALVGITAHLGLFFHGQLSSGDVVFVPGGTGGVGSAVVQLCGLQEPWSSQRQVPMRRPNSAADLAPHMSSCTAQKTSTSGSRKSPLTRAPFSCGLKHSARPRWNAASR